MLGPNTTTYGDIAPRTAGYAAAKLLERAQYLMVTEAYGQSQPIPQKHTKTITWRRYESLLPAVAPLAEGIPPAGQKLTKTDVTATLEQYGDKVEYTDVIQDTHEDPILNEMIDLCGEEAAETVERVRLSILKAGTNVFYAGGVASRAYVNSPPTRGDFRKINRSFYRNKAQYISSIVKASAMVSTEPVAPAFFALAHTDLGPDLLGMTGFVEMIKYANSDKARPGEIGKCEEIRFISTPLIEPWQAAATSASANTTYLSATAIPSTASYSDVYPILIFAKNAYGIVPLQGKNVVTPMVWNPGKPTPSDPLGQIGFVSWKIWQTVARLNELWMARLECTCTANPA